MIRTSRACVRCRRHKSKCILRRSQDILHPPCQRCIQAGVECVLATSNRGGPRRHRKPSGEHLAEGSPLERHQGLHFRTPLNSHGVDTLMNSSCFNSGIIDDNALDQNLPRPVNAAQDTAVKSFAATLAATDLHGTSDALNVLSGIAVGLQNKTVGTGDSPSLRGRGLYGGQLDAESPRGDTDELADYYEPVKCRQLSSHQVEDLVERFARVYHRFYPIVPLRALRKSSLNETARDEPNLLAAMITIAAKDIAGGEETFVICLRHMERLITDIVAGKRCTTEAVEALLLLAEWVPLSDIPDASVNACGQEDMAAWMHIGLALRLAQSLGLDRTDIDMEKARNGSNLKSSRDRLVWIACYLSDRQISVRTGRPFHWPRLRPSSPQELRELCTSDLAECEEDGHSSVFAARLELTQIFSKVHEELYCNMSIGLEKCTSYLDEFQEAISTWKRIWGALTCSPMVKVLLDMSYEYSRLYTNAFIFQKLPLHAFSFGEQSIPGDDIGRTTTVRGTRFIHESLDAAKSLLTILNNYIPTHESCAYLPIRFPLYCVNAAVFLFKIWCSTIMSAPERNSTRRLVFDTIKSLREQSIRETDLGVRYAKLLQVLWENIEIEPSDNQAHQPSDNRAHQSRPQENFCIPQGEFSWLDLGSIGNFVLDEHDRTAELDFHNMQQRIRAASENPWDDPELTNVNGIWPF